MELLDRYLGAIRFWLPKGQREDILAELTEDIRSEIEERESPLGRKLTEPELADLLQKRGSPYRVACRYLPQRYLIGPAFFPLYTLLLKGIALFYLVPWFIAWLFMVAFLPSYRAAHPGWALAATLNQLWGLALYAFAFTTLGVMFLERSAEGTGLIDRWDRKWNPRLARPEPKDPLRIPRGESIGQFFGGLVFAAYWLGAFRLPTIEEIQIGFAPILSQTLYWPIVIIALAGSAVAAWNLVQPRWTRTRLFVWIVICGLEIVQALVIASAGTLVYLNIAEASPEKLALLTRWANQSLRIMILAIGAVSLWEAVMAVRRLMKLRSAAPAGAAPAAVRRAV